MLLLLAISFQSGFPTGVENMGGAPQNLMGVRGVGGGLSQNMERGGGMGELKMLLKNTSEGVHLIVKLEAISLQAPKFSKNGLLHTCFKDFS